jgi:hypothetical protein
MSPHLSVSIDDKFLRNAGVISPILRISALAPMMSFSRDNLESIRASTRPLRDLCRKMNWIGGCQY